MNWRQKFIAEVIWFYFDEKRFAQYKDLIDNKLYTEVQAYYVAKNM